MEPIEITPRPLVVCDAGPLIHLDETLDHPGALFLTDDTAARMAAASLEISAHGSIGILVRAIRRNQRSKEQILTILGGLPANSSLHIKRSLLESVILEVSQSR